MNDPTPAGPSFNLRLSLHESLVVHDEDLRLGGRTLAYGSDPDASARLGPGVAVLEGGPLAATGPQRGGPLRLPAGTVLELRGLPGPLARRVYRENLVNPKWTVEIIGSDAEQRAGLLAEKKWLEERLAGVEAAIKAMSSRRLRRWPAAQKTLAG